MKNKDCWRLAKISLNARKKATRNTIIGIAVSFIIIIPLFYAIFGVKLSVKEQFNSNPGFMYANFKSSQAGFKLENDIDIYNSRISGNAYDYIYINPNIDKIEKFKEVEDDFFHYVSIVKDLHNWNNTELETIVVNGIGYSLSKFNQNFEERTQLAILYESSLDKIKDPNYGILNEKYNKGFVANGARQVILSERYLAMAGLTPEQVYGRKISIKINEYSRSNHIKMKANSSENYLDTVKFNLFQDFEVVGIIDSKRYRDSATGKYQEIIDNTYEQYEQIFNANIIVSGASYFGANGMPEIDHSYYIVDNDIVCDFGDLNEKNSKTKYYLCLGANSYNPYTIYAKTVGQNYSGKIALVQKNCYLFLPGKNCVKQYDEVTKILEKTYPIYDDMYQSVGEFKLTSRYRSRSYSDYYTIDFAINIITSVLSIFALIIVVAALINLLNTIIHSVHLRKNYLGVMRAIGAKSRDIPKLYFFEIIRLFCRAFVWIAIFGLALCIGFKIIIDNVFSYIINLYDPKFVISMPWYPIPLIILAFASLLFVISLIYAFGCCYKVAHDPIVESLES